MKQLLIFALLAALFVGCGTLQSLQEGVASAKEMIGDAKDAYDAVKNNVGQLTEAVAEVGPALEQAKAEAKEKADADGDGEIAGAERYAYWAALAAAALEWFRRKMKSFDGRITHERSKRKALEGKVAG